MTNLAKTPEEYTSEFVREFSDLDENRIRRFMAKYGSTIPSNSLVFWCAVHKAITANIKFPMKLRSQSKRWLIEHNFEPWDDGNVSV